MGSFLVTFLSSPVMDYIAGWEAWPVICLVVGLVLLMLEVIIPGFGVTGILGVAALIAAFILRADTLNDLLITLAIVIVLLVIMGIIFFRSFNRGIISRSPLMLREMVSGKSTSLSSDEIQSLVGLEGVCLNDLRPSGFADFGGRRLDVVSMGDFIEKGAAVRIVSVEGIRITVAHIAD